jgi:hypothetical protein
MKHNYIKSILQITTTLLFSSVSFAMENNFNGGYNDDEALTEAMRLSNLAVQSQDAYTIGLSADEEFQLALAISASESEKPKHLNPTPIVMKANPDDLSKLVEYILNSRGQVVNQFTSLINEKLSFIEMPFCLCVQTLELSQNPFADIKNDIKGKLFTYCEDKGFNYEVALPLLEHYFIRHLDHQISTHLATKTYLKIYQQISGSILELSKMSEDDLTRKFNELGLPGLYQDLKNQNNDLGKHIRSLCLTAQDFLVEAPKVYLTKLLWVGDKKVNKPHSNFPIPFADEMKVEPKRVVRPELPTNIVALQMQVADEFDSRKKLSGDETVMVYGEKVAKQYYLKLEDAIQDLFGRLNTAKQPMHGLKDVQGIKNFYELVKGELEHNQKDQTLVATALKLAQDRQNNPSLRITAYLTDGRTAYDYLLMVASDVNKYFNLLKNSNKEEAYTLAGVFFGKLAEQDKQCQGGLTGRLFTVHSSILNMLVSHYNQPIKQIS